MNRLTTILVLSLAAFSGVVMASHCNVCPTGAARYEITISGIANRDCASCSAANGTFILEAVDGVGAGGVMAVPCLWRSSVVNMCPEFTNPSGSYWWIMEVGLDVYGNQQVTVSLNSNKTSPTDISMVQYRGSANLPSAGSITVPRAGPSPLNRCQNYQASVTVRQVP